MCLDFRLFFILKLESLAQIKAIGIRLNNPKMSDEKQEDEKVEEKDQGKRNSRQTENSKQDEESKHKRRKSKRDKRDWDVTDEILLLKKMEENNQEGTMVTISRGDENNDKNVSNGHDVNASNDDVRTQESNRDGDLGISVEDKEKSNHNGNKEETSHISFHRIRQERKTAILFVFILLFLFVSWSPIYIIDVFLAFEVNVDQNLINFAVLLSHFNSAINPLLYGSKREFRRIFKRWIFVICNRFCCKNRVSAWNEETVNDVTNTLSHTY